MIKCRDCKYCEDQYLSPLQGGGVFRFHYCAKEPTDLTIVEPDMDRLCHWFNLKPVTIECPVCHKEIPINEAEEEPDKPDAGEDSGGNKAYKP